MENVLTITNLKQNILEFNAGLEGISDNEMKVRLIIEANGMDFGFDAKRVKGTLWEVIIPPLPMLEKTAYPFRMDVVSEGYFFDPLHGTMNVVGAHELYITDPKNTNITPRTVEELPKKHTAKPAGTKEIDNNTEKVSPKVLKPIASSPEDKKPADTSIADSMARLRANAGIKKKKPAPKKIVKRAAIKESITEEEIAATSLEEMIENISKPTPKKKRAPRKAKAKPKAGTIKKITEDKEVISKPEEEVALESKKEEAVKDILSETDETKKVLTHPTKKGGKVTIH